MHEVGLPCQIERVDLAKKLTQSGEDYFVINPKGCVPALQLDNGQILTEAQVIVQYIADQVPDSNMVPPAGSFARYRVMEWLSYISTDVQKGFGPLFNPDTTDETRVTVHANLDDISIYLPSSWNVLPISPGERYGIVDAYLFTVLNWASFVKLDLNAWPLLPPYLLKIAARPAVKAAMIAERLIKSRRDPHRSSIHP